MRWPKTLRLWQENPNLQFHHSETCCPTQNGIFIHSHKCGSILRVQISEIFIDYNFLVSIYKWYKKTRDKACVKFLFEVVVLGLEVAL
jgi:hypothetical protein